MSASAFLLHRLMPGISTPLLAAPPIRLRAFSAALLVAAALACTRSTPTPTVQVQPLDADAFQELVLASRGRPLLVNLWATWCEPCKQELLTLEALSRDLGESVHLIGVSVDAPERIAQVRELLALLNVSFPQYIRMEADDEAFINAVDPGWNGALPSTFVYDDSGIRARRLVGLQTRESLIQALEPLLAGAAIASGER
ncbi:MAG: TlpA disulfide reductase family protein [Acidobacteriota bacterium]